MAFKSIVPSTTSRPRTESRKITKGQSLLRVLSETFDFSTVLLIGGVLQGLLVILIPRFWVLLPAMIVLLSRAGTTLAITKGWRSNPYMKGAIHTRATAVIPDNEGEFNTEGNAANEKVTILLLGLRSNHPMGYFAPHMKKLNELNMQMVKALDAEAPNNGFLGSTSWTSKTAEGSQDILLISYWRSLEDVHRFSVGPTHKAAWQWWESNAPELKHIGISHEVFQADKAMYENVFINFQPTRIGATSFLRHGDEMIGGTVPDSWINPLVDASRGKLRNSKGRLGWSDKVEPEIMLEKEYSYRD